MYRFVSRFRFPQTLNTHASAHEPNRTSNWNRKQFFSPFILSFVFRKKMSFTFYGQLSSIAGYTTIGLTHLKINVQLFFRLEYSILINATDEKIKIQTTRRCLPKTYLFEIVIVGKHVHSNSVAKIIISLTQRTMWVVDAVRRHTARPPRNVQRVEVTRPDDVEQEKKTEKKLKSASRRGGQRNDEMMVRFSH